MSQYRAALDYLYGFTDYEKQSGYAYSPERFDLARVDRLLALLGNPHQQFQSVHIAGTKGKGSTAAIIASILSQAGYRTALYTSPHLHTFRERIQIDGALISKANVVAGVKRLQATQVPDITTFELITALAFDTFGRQHADLAVIEVGMGGRLDATNVITPLVSIITSISYDHMMYLGHSLAEIAGEKAGIIKHGVPVISAPQPAAALQVLRRVAIEKNAPFTAIDQAYTWKTLACTPDGQQFSVSPTGSRSSERVYKLPLLGRHQQVNATTALAAIEQLRAGGLAIFDQAIHMGMQKVQWPARFQVLGQAPRLIVDGAHNGDSMQKLVETIREVFSYNKLILILGISADKDLERMLDAVLPAADQIWVTQAHHPRAADVDQIIEQIAARDKHARAVPIDQALDTVLETASQDDLICATGSLFVAAEIRSKWFQHNHYPLPPSDIE